MPNIKDAASKIDNKNKAAAMATKSIFSDKRVKIPLLIFKQKELYCKLKQIVNEPLNVKGKPRLDTWWDEDRKKSRIHKTDLQVRYLIL